MSAPKSIIVPRPRREEYGEGEGAIISRSSLVVGSSSPEASFAADSLRDGLALILPGEGGGTPASAHGSARVELRLDAASGPGPESYCLEVGGGKVSIASPGPAGLFYGVQSLKQLAFAYRLGPEGRGGRPDRAPLPSLIVEDAPRFAYRGFMLDVCRHFFGVEEVERLIDLAALHKLNFFHWHLTDDQGWRLPVEAYPELARKASRRRETKGDGIPVEGAYTKDEIRRVVAFAASRNVTIVPEVEMPGHLSAALATYPELACFPRDFETATTFGIFEDIACAGKEEAYRFFETVLRETMDLFPGPYVHLGGDEAPKARWKACPRCREMMDKEGLADEEGLQGYFTNRAIEVLKSGGRRAIVWNESVYSGGLDPSALMQFWKEDGGARKSVAEMRRGREFIVTDFSHYYLDFPYGMNSLRKAYDYEPLREGLGKLGDSAMRGVEAPLWTEYVPDRRTLDERVFPRLSAVAETAWTEAAAKDYADFSRRLGGFSDYLSAHGATVVPEGQANPSWPRALVQTALHFLKNIGLVPLLKYLLGINN